MGGVVSAPITNAVADALLNIEGSVHVVADRWDMLRPLVIASYATDELSDDTVHKFAAMGREAERLARACRALSEATP